MVKRDVNDIIGQQKDETTISAAASKSVKVCFLLFLQNLCNKVTFFSN
jgi:hypothetical protein